MGDGGSQDQELGHSYFSDNWWGAGSCLLQEVHTSGCTALNKVKRFFVVRVFTRGPVAKTPLSQCRGPRFEPWSGDQIPHDETKDQRSCLSQLRSREAKTIEFQTKIFPLQQCFPLASHALLTCGPGKGYSSLTVSKSSSILPNLTLYVPQLKSSYGVSLPLLTQPHPLQLCFHL